MKSHFDFQDSTIVKSVTCDISFLVRKCNYSWGHQTCTPVKWEAADSMTPSADRFRPRGNSLTSFTIVSPLITDTSAHWPFMRKCSWPMNTITYDMKTQDSSVSICMLQLHILKPPFPPVCPPKSHCTSMTRRTSDISSLRAVRSRGMSKCLGRCRGNSDQKQRSSQAQGEEWTERGEVGGKVMEDCRLRAQGDGSEWV